MNVRLHVMKIQHVFENTMASDKHMNEEEEQHNYNFIFNEVEDEIIGTGHNMFLKFMTYFNTSFL